MSRRRSDEELFQAHAGGDTAAFEALVERSWPEAYRIARHCLKDASAAEDVAQEVFLQVARQRPELDRPGSFGRWFRTLVYNAVRMHARSRTRRQAREGVAAERRRGHQEPEGERQAEAGEVRDHLSRLPVDLRFALTLHYLEGRTHKEVAEALGCPPGTASSRIRRGLDELRSSLAVAGCAAPVPLLGLLLAEPAEAAPAAPAGAAAAALASTSSARRALPALAAGLAALAVGAASVAALLEVPDAPPPPTNDVALARQAPEETSTEDPEEALPVNDPKPSPTERKASPKTPAGITETPDEPGHVVPGPRPKEQPQKLGFSGRVLDAQTNAPLAGVQVALLTRTTQEGPHWPSSTKRTRADGSFRVVAQRIGQRVKHVGVVAFHPGYQPLIRSLGGVNELARSRDLLLVPGPSHRFHGRTVDRAGQPVSSVKLEAEVVMNSPEQGTFFGEGRAPRGGLEIQGLRLTLQSDAVGRFALSGLPHGASVSVGLGYSSRRWSASPIKPPVGRNPGAVDLVLTPSARLTLEAADAQGQPVKAWVRVSGPESFTTWFEGKRSILGAPGTYEIQACFEVGGADARALRNGGVLHLTRRVTLAPGGRTRLLLEAPAPASLGTLTCRVRDAKGRPMEGIRVFVRRAATTRRWRDQVRVRTNAAGEAVLHGLPRGRYQVKTRAKRSAPAQATVQVGDASTVDLTADPILPLAGVVVDEANNPVQDVQITVFPGGGGSGTEARTNDRGEFRLDYPSGYVSVDLQAKGYQRASKRFRHAGKPLRFRLTRGQEIRVEGRGAGPDGTEVVGVLVLGSTSHYARAKVFDGRFELRWPGNAPTAAGRVVVRVGHHVASEHPLISGRPTLVLDPVPLVRGQTVRGRVKLPKGAVTARVGCGDDSLYDQRTDAQGRFTLRGVPSGVIKLSASVMVGERFYYGTAQVDASRTPDVGTIELKAESESGIAPDEFNAIRISITDTKGNLARAGFRDGDVLVGVNGTRFTDPAQMAELDRAVVKAGVTPTYQVLRGGKTIDLKLDLGAVMKPGFEKLGGSFKPIRRK